MPVMTNSLPKFYPKIKAMTVLGNFVVICNIIFVWWRSLHSKIRRRGVDQASLEVVRVYVHIFYYQVQFLSSVASLSPTDYIYIISLLTNPLFSRFGLYWAKYAHVCLGLSNNSTSSKGGLVPMINGQPDRKQSSVFRDSDVRFLENFLPVCFPPRRMVAQVLTAAWTCRSTCIQRKHAGTWRGLWEEVHMTMLRLHLGFGKENGRGSSKGR